MNRLIEWFQVDTNSPNEVTDDRQFIRERILTAVLVGAAFFGAAAYFINLRTTFQLANWGWIFIYTLAFGWILAIAFIRRIPYSFRSYTLIVILYALGIISALQFGAAGDSRVWFFGAVILASLFLGFRVGFGSLVVATITYLVIGWFMNQHIIPLPEPGTLLNFDNFDSWTTTGIPFFAISAIIVLSIGVLVNGLNTSVRKNRDLAQELSEDRAKLEERSLVLERREVQIRTAAEISRSAVAELDPDILFQRVVDLIQSRFGLYYVGVFVIDETGHYAILRAGTGEAGRKMLAQNHRLPIGSTSMVGYAISRKEARIASDTGLEAIRFNNPDLPDTHSELALPMISGDRALGAITVQSNRSDAFDQDDIVVLQGIADSIATALDNANLFQQLQDSLEEVRTTQRQYIRDSWESIPQISGVSHTHQRETIESNIQSPFSSAGLDFPLMLRDQMIGNLSLEAERPHLTPQEQSFIEAIIQQTALALENIRLVDETQRTAQQEQIIGSISEELSRAMDVDSVLKAAVRELGKLPNIREVSIHIEPEQQ